MESQTDNALMKLIQAGETAHLAILFERHQLALYRYLLGLTGNQATSEDLVQEVFFKVIKHARTYDPALPFPVWIYGMARNAYFDLYRKRRREAPEEAKRDVKSDAPMAEELLMRDQDIAFLQQALQELPEDKREVLVLSRFGNLRYDEIGRLLGCETGAVKLRVFRALKQLRKVFCELRNEKVYGH